jgi:hypothetical protein
MGEKRLLNARECSLAFSRTAFATSSHDVGTRDDTMTRITPAATAAAATSARPRCRRNVGTTRVVAARAARAVAASPRAASSPRAVVGVGSSNRRAKRRPIRGTTTTRASRGDAPADATAAARARLDAIQAEDEIDVEDPGERGGFDIFSGGVFTGEVLAYWEASNAFFFPRLLLVAGTALGLAASIPQSLGGVFRQDDDALRVLGANVVFFVLAAALAAADLRRRKTALDRLQRELALGDMQVIQRDKFRNERVFPLQSLRQAARVAIVYGDAEKVAKDLAAATPFRRRLEQSRILVVPVVERGGSSENETKNDDGVADVGPGRWELLKDVVQAWPGAGAGRWLAWPTKNDAWAGYFRRLLASAGVTDPAANRAGGYVTLGVTGQVRGSGAGSPNWDVLLSTFPRNRPGNAADAAAEAAWREATVDSGAVGALGAVDASVDPAAAEKLKDIRADGAARPIGTTLALPSSGAAAAVLRAHEAFYDALARGDEDAMRAAWRPAASLVASNAGALDSGVGFLIGKGARLDGWETVLRPDRRPEGLKLSDVDVTVERDVATVTVLETVANGATLLATQTYEKAKKTTEDDEDEVWILRSHYTIPYGKDTVAKIALRCDERGCVAVPAKAVASAKTAA